MGAPGTMTTHLLIYGRFWSGAKGVYQYSSRVDQRAGGWLNNTLETKRDVLRIAGDFESVVDWKVVQETNTFEPSGRGLYRRIDEFKTLRGWRNGFSNQRYDRAENR